MSPQDYAASTQITHLWSKHKGHPGPLIWKAAAYSRLIIFIWKKKIYFNSSICHYHIPKARRFLPEACTIPYLPQPPNNQMDAVGRSQKNDEDQPGSHALVFVSHTLAFTDVPGIWADSLLTPPSFSYHLLYCPLASVVRGRKSSLPLRHPWAAALGTTVEGPSGFVRLKEQCEGKAVRDNFSFRMPWSIFTRTIMEFRNCSAGMIEKLERGKWHFKPSEGHDNQLMIT